MPPRAVRAKTRLARAAPLDAEQTEETQAHPASPAPARETRENASSDDEQEDRAEGDARLFHGHRFYLARTLRAERRHELRILITQNGGDVVAEMAGGTIEIVERAHLRAGENWVAAEFVEDSIRDGELKLVTHYMAPREDKPRRTPSGRLPKRLFTVDEQAKMLRFLKENHPKYFNRPTVPASIWRIAAEAKLLDRSPQSMHEHYRKQLAKLTKRERAVVFERAGIPNPELDSIQAETEGETETETELRPRDVVAEAPSAAVQREEEQEQEEQQPQEEREADEDEPSVARKRAHSDEMEAKHQDDGDAAESEEEIQGRAKKRTKKAHVTEEVPEQQEGESPDEQTLPEDPLNEDEAERTQTPPHTEPSEQDEPVEPSEQAEAPSNEGEKENELSQEGEAATSGGEVFRSYWHSVAFDATRRPQLDRFFIPPPPPPNAEPSQNVLLNSAAATVHRTPQRSRRRSDANETPASQSTPTPQKHRRGGRTSMDSVGTPGHRTPARAAQEELLSQLEEMVGQRMTPPSRRKSLDRLIPVSQASEGDTDALIARLQFETAHDFNTICSALYWASGDSNVARAFLLGHAPVEIWSPKDDQLLVDYMRDDITEAELANARHRGAFETMSTKRTTRDILRRIQFLL